MAPIVNNDVYEAGVTDLTKEQLISILQGRQRTGDEVGGTRRRDCACDTPHILRYESNFPEIRPGRPGGGFQRSYGDRRFRSSSPECKGHRGAIGYVALSYLTGDAGVSTLAIDGVEPTLENTYSGDYPVWTYEHMYTKGEPDEVTKTFSRLHYV